MFLKLPTSSDMRLLLTDGSGVGELVFPRSGMTMISHGLIDDRDPHTRARPALLFAVAEVRGGRPVLIGGGSPRGTYVNGRRLAVMRSIEVRDGDEIVFGSTRYVAAAGNRDPRAASRPHDRSAARMSPSHVLAASEAAYTAGDRDKALRLLVQCVHDHPDERRARLSLGILQYQMGHVEEAGDVLYAYLRDEPANLSALAYYGLVLQRKGRLADAIAVMERAYRMAPSDPLATKINECRAALSAARARTHRRSPPPRMWAGSVVGVATSVRSVKNIRKGELTFTLKVSEPRPRELRVTMKGGSIEGGTVRDGQWVEIPPNARWSGASLVTKQLYNLSTRQRLNCGQSQVVNRGLRQQFGMPRGFRF
jgi:hypothetical protein